MEIFARLARRARSLNQSALLAVFCTSKLGISTLRVNFGIEIISFVSF